MVRVLRNGRIMIPAEFRRLLAVAEDVMFQVTLVDGGLIIKPIQGQELSQALAARSLQIGARSRPNRQKTPPQPSPRSA
jgi:AbrB family looped-hinge helix DNA binding protein